MSSPATKPDPESATSNADLPEPHTPPSQPGPHEPSSRVDDFEEFATDGEVPRSFDRVANPLVRPKLTFSQLVGRTAGEDWPDEQSYGASLGPAPDKHGKVGCDKLWDDDWDNDDVDDDFSAKLR